MRSRTTVRALRRAAMPRRSTSTHIPGHQRSGHTRRTRSARTIVDCNRETAAAWHCKNCQRTQQMNRTHQIEAAGAS